MFDANSLKSHEKICLTIERFCSDPEGLFEALFYANGQPKGFVLNGLTLFTAAKIFELLNKKDAKWIGSNGALKEALLERFSKDPLSKIVFMMQAKKASHYLGLAYQPISTVGMYTDQELVSLLENKQMLEYLIQTHFYFFSDPELCVLIVLAYPDLFPLVLDKASFSDHLVIQGNFIEFVFQCFLKEVDFNDFVEKEGDWKSKIFETGQSYEYDGDGNCISEKKINHIKCLRLKDFLLFIEPLCNKNRLLPDSLLSH